MNQHINTFLREHRYQNGEILKRVIKEGSGSLIDSSSILKIDTKIYRAIDGSKLETNSQQFFRISTEQLENASSDLPAFQQVLITMRLGEEAWIKIPAGHHQENDEAWEDLWFNVKLISIESLEIPLPEAWKFLREQRIGPNKILRKRVICEGSGECPKINMLVTYYYTVYKKDGKVYESYTNKSHVLPKFPSQDTHVGIYHALITMREGEECIILMPTGFVKSKYKGELWVSIHLLYINECVNALLPQNVPFLREEDLGHGIIKRVLSEGQGDVLDNVAKIWIEVEGWLEDSYQFQKFKTEVVSYTKEGKSYGEAQNLLLKTMRKGEVAFIKAPPGTHLYQETLENETLWIKYTITEYLENLPDISLIKNIEERLIKSLEFLEIANRLYKSGIRAESKVFYNKINSALVVKIGFFDDYPKEIKEKYDVIKSRVLSNLALVHLKDAEEFKEKDLIEKNLKKVFEYSGLELDINPNNIKTLYRRGKAFFIKGDYEKAKADIVKVLSIDPMNTESKKLLKNIEKEIKYEEIREKHVFKEVFNKDTWEKQALQDEENQKKIRDNYDEIEEKEQETEVINWLSRLNNKNVGQIDAINLLML